MDIAFSNKQFNVLGYFEFIGGGREGATNLAKGWLPHFVQSLNTEVLVSFAWNPESEEPLVTLDVAAFVLSVKRKS